MEMMNWMVGFETKSVSYKLYDLMREIMAQKLLPELGLLLEKEKNIIKINRAHLELGKAQVENYKLKAKMKPKFYGNLVQIKGVWANLAYAYKRNKG
ncbi:hypothetical protein L1987_02819 [Smallanthus sonchifolius]|uniref:Uncharacterized protein n=1 Tax=Smallanthus sonchifolius TaxID=185202 RepID=A0ACB9K936_9ASTR|nr:hypothetical protein L1987_02819 [Smallanthus sonchifolius]